MQSVPESKQRNAKQKPLQLVAGQVEFAEIAENTAGAIEILRRVGACQIPLDKLIDDEDALKAFLGGDLVKEHNAKVAVKKVLNQVPTYCQEKRGMSEEDALQFAEQLDYLQRPPKSKAVYPATFIPNSVMRDLTRALCNGGKYCRMLVGLETGWEITDGLWEKLKPLFIGCVTNDSVIDADASYNPRSTNLHTDVDGVRATNLKECYDAIERTIRDKYGHVIPRNYDALPGNVQAKLIPENPDAEGGNTFVVAKGTQPSISSEDLLEIKNNLEPDQQNPKSHFCSANWERLPENVKNSVQFVKANNAVGRPSILMWLAKDPTSPYPWERGMHGSMGGTNPNASPRVEWVLPFQVVPRETFDRNEYKHCLASIVFRTIYNLNTPHTVLAVKPNIDGAHGIQNRGYKREEALFGTSPLDPKLRLIRPKFDSRTMEDCYDRTIDFHTTKVVKSLKRKRPIEPEDGEVVGYEDWCEEYGATVKAYADNPNMSVDDPYFEKLQHIKDALNASIMQIL